MKPLERWRKLRRIYLADWWFWKTFSHPDAPEKKNAESSIAQADKYIKAYEDLEKDA